HRNPPVPGASRCSDRRKPRPKACDLAHIVGGKSCHVKYVLFSPQGPVRTSADSTHNVRKGSGRSGPCGEGMAMGKARLFGRAALSAVLAGSLALGSGAVAATAKDVDLTTSSRASVAKAYNRVLAPALGVKTGWSGPISSCKRCSESAASRKATRKAVNFVRTLN